MTAAIVCPVCNGNGLVASGFYGSSRREGNTLLWSASVVNPETCRSCNGKGYILVEQVEKEES